MARLRLVWLNIESHSSNMTENIGWKRNLISNTVVKTGWSTRRAFYLSIKLVKVGTLGDIFKTLEMRRFFKVFAIFSDGQNFGFQNKIRRIIFDVFLLIVTSSIHHLHDKLLIWIIRQMNTSIRSWIVYRSKVMNEALLHHSPTL